MSNFICPCEGSLTSPYGYRTHPITGKPSTFHHGVDIAKKGTVEIKASAAGKVTRADWSNSYGYIVIIQHTINGQRFDTTYAHLRSTPSVKKGQTVKQGQLIGYMGTTGNSTGQHLHFEIQKGGWKWVASSDSKKNMPNSVDPLKYITIGKVATTLATSQPAVAASAPVTLPTSNKNATITEYLNSIGVDSSYKNRARLAAKYGIQGYKGTAAQNTLLTKLCRTKLCFFVFTGTVKDKATILKVQDRIKQVKPTWNMYPVQNSSGLWQVKIDAFSTVPNAQAACKVVESLGYIARYVEA